MYRRKTDVIQMLNDLEMFYYYYSIIVWTLTDPNQEMFIQILCGEVKKKKKIIFF